MGGSNRRDRVRYAEDKVCRRVNDLMLLRVRDVEFSTDERLRTHRRLNLTNEQVIVCNL